MTFENHYCKNCQEGTIQEILPYDEIISAQKTICSKCGTEDWV